MTTVSVVVSARNEEGRLKRCLDSVTWANELIVIDNSSTDKTAQIAKKYTSRIWRVPNNLMLNINKNLGFSKAKSDWILSLDADEEVTPQLTREIDNELRKNNSIQGYWIPRKNIIFGKWIQHGLWWPDEQLRLFRRGKGEFPCKHVHEYIAVDGQTEHLQEPYIHYNYDSISQFITKMDTIYTENEVGKLLTTGYQLAWYDAIRFPISDFVKIFFAQEGYKDGLHGLVLSILQSFYSFIVFTKLWEKQSFSDRDVSLPSLHKEFILASKEISYWSLTGQIKETPSWLTKVWFKIKRKYVI